MLIKPIDELDKELEQLREDEAEEELQGPSPWRFAFLILLIVFGVYYSFFFHSNREEISERINVASERKIAEPPRLTLSGAPSKEIEEVASESIADISTRSARMAGEYLSMARTTGEEVLGAATQQARDTATASAQKVSQEIYKVAIGSVIRNLLNQLPDEVQQELLSDICSEEGGCEGKE